MSVRCWRQSDGPAPGMLVELSCPICGQEVEWVNGTIATYAEACAVVVCPKGHESQLLVRLLAVARRPRAEVHPSEVGLAS